MLSKQYVIKAKTQPRVEALKLTLNLVKHLAYAHTYVLSRLSFEVK